MKCCDLTSGKLRHKLSLQREYKTQDNTGGYSSEWRDYRTVYCQIIPQAGMNRSGETFHSQRLETRITHKIYLRYFSDIEETDRINYNGREMQIRKILNLEERNKWIELHAEEGAVN